MRYKWSGETSLLLLEVNPPKRFQLKNDHCRLSSREDVRLKIACAGLLQTKIYRGINSAQQDKCGTNFSKEGTTFANMVVLHCTPRENTTLRIYSHL